MTIFFLHFILVKIFINDPLLPGCPGLPCFPGIPGRPFSPLMLIPGSPVGPLGPGRPKKKVLSSYKPGACNLSKKKTEPSVL